MTDDGLDPRLAGALRDYARGGLRPVNATVIAHAAVERSRRRQRVPGTTRVAWWLTRLPARRVRARWLVTAIAAAAVVAVAGISLVPSFGIVGGLPLLPSSSPSPTEATGSASPAATSADSPDLAHSLTVDGVSFSLRLPPPKLGHGWGMFGSLLVSKSISGPQGAEAVVYWAGFPDGTEADPCIDAPIERWTATDAAEYIASAPGTALVAAPEDVTVGGYPAKHVVVVVREEAGCDPGFFYNWKAQTGGDMWVNTVPGDRISVWLVQVGPRLLFIAGETHRDLVPGVAITDSGRARLEQEIQQIVDSIEFDGASAAASGPCAQASVASPATAPDMVAGWAPTGSMAEGRDGHSATLLRDGRVLVVGGMNAREALASAELYDPSIGSWTTTGSMATARAGHSATLLADGSVLVAGGISYAGGPGEDIELGSAELYDPKTGTWSGAGRMLEAVSGGATTLLPDGRVLVAGGWGSTEPFGPKLASAQLYDPQTRTWAATGSMAQGRHGHAAVLLTDGTVLVAGGYAGPRLASTEVYDPASGLWADGARLPEPFLGYSEVLLPGGAVLIAGGDVPSGPGAVGSAHAARYDPCTLTWALTGSMLAARLGQVASLLPDGRVLVAGGKRAGGDPTDILSSAEIYDPATGAWTETLDMRAARSSHTAVVLADGRVLVVGGSTNGGESLASAELFSLVQRS